MTSQLEQRLSEDLTRIAAEAPPFRGLRLRSRQPSAGWTRLVPILAAVAVALIVLGGGYALQQYSAPPSSAPVAADDDEPKAPSDVYSDEDAAAVYSSAVRTYIAEGQLGEMPLVEIRSAPVAGAGWHSESGSFDELSDETRNSINDELISVASIRWVDADNTSGCPDAGPEEKGGPDPAVRITLGPIHATADGVEVSISGRVLKPGNCTEGSLITYLLSYEHSQWSITGKSAPYAVT